MPFDLKTLRRRAAEGDIASLECMTREFRRRNGLGFQEGTDLLEFLKEAETFVSRYEEAVRELVATTSQIDLSVEDLNMEGLALSALHHLYGRCEEPLMSPAMRRIAYSIWQYHGRVWQVVSASRNNLRFSISPDDNRWPVQPLEVEPRDSVETWSLVVPVEVHRLAITADRLRELLMEVQRADMAYCQERGLFFDVDRMEENLSIGAEILRLGDAVHRHARFVRHRQSFPTPYGRLEFAANPGDALCNTARCIAGGTRDVIVGLQSRLRSNYPERKEVREHEIRVRDLVFARICGLPVHA